MTDFLHLVFALWLQAIHIVCEGLSLTHIFLFPFSPFFSSFAFTPSSSGMSRASRIRKAQGAPCEGLRGSEGSPCYFLRRFIPLFRFVCLSAALFFVSPRVPFLRCTCALGYDKTQRLVCFNLMHLYAQAPNHKLVTLLMMRCTDTPGVRNQLVENSIGKPFCTNPETARFLGA